MASLKDTVISGSLRVTDTIFSTNLNLSSLTASYAVLTDANKNLISRAITDNTSATAVTASTNLITANTLYYHKGNSNIVTVGTITSGTWNATTINPNKGGTGVNSYAKGDILYAGDAIANTATTALSKLALGTAGYTLQATANGPAWVQTVAVANGGTGKTSWTQWGILYASASTTLANTAAGTAGYLLQGNGSAAPSWIQATNANTASTIVKRDASGNFSAGTITANLTGNCSGSSGSCTGNAATATSAEKWTTARDLTIGNKTQSVNGASNVSWTLRDIQAVPYYQVGDTSSTTYVLVTINKETSWMLNFTLKLYQSYVATDIQISGYNYGTNHWYQPQACILGSTSTDAIKVYFGYTANWKLWVAVDGGSYNGAAVVDICNGYTQIDLENAITITKVSGLPGTLQSTVTAYRPYYRNETVSNATTASACSGNAATATTASACSGNAASATKVGIAAIWMYPNNSNEVNFGGTYTGNRYIYFGYRATDSRQIPTRFYFGSTGTAEVYAGKVYNAVWNDYAEYRKVNINEPGRVVVPSKTGTATKSTMRLQAGGRIISDTFGCSVGKSNEAKTPLGMAGRVLAYPYRTIEEYQIGDCVCTAPNGTVDIMTREEIKEYPDRIIGIVNEIPTYEIWEQKLTNDDPIKSDTLVQSVKVNGRIWIDIK